MKIGSAITKIRKSRKLSQQDLSELTGISQTSISQIETDTCYPHQSTLLKICKTLNVKEIELYLKSK